MPKRTHEPDIFDDYVSFRLRLNELAVLHCTLAHLAECRDLPDERRKEQVQAQRLAIATHLAGFFEDSPDGLNVLRLWSRYFPQQAHKIRAWRKDWARDIRRLRTVRNTAGAHADPIMETQNEGRRWLFLQRSDFKRLLGSFRAAARHIAKQERFEPVLCLTIREYGLTPGALPAFTISAR